MKEGSDGADKEDLWRLTGGYRHVNQRLRALLAARHARFRTIDVPVEGGAAPRPSPAAALAAWRPAPRLLAEVTPNPTLAALRVRRAGTTHTSYSRIKAAQGGYHPPSQLSDEVVVPLPALAEDDLPGGARSGIFLHALLEQLPLPAALADPTLAVWSARDDVRTIIEGALRRHGREARLYDAAARLAHAALTAPLPVVGGQLDGLGRAARTTRELEFLFPFPDNAGGADRGFVKGFVDVIFEHEGRTYFGDWKTDRLPVWDDATVDAHMDANYGLQERLYSLALARMLGIDDAAAHEARFGGTLYVFVRGLPTRRRCAAGGRPSPIWSAGVPSWPRPWPGRSSRERSSLRDRTGHRCGPAGSARARPAAKRSIWRSRRAAGQARSTTASVAPSRCSSWRCSMPASRGRPGCRWRGWPNGCPGSGPTRRIARRRRRSPSPSPAGRRRFRSRLMSGVRGTTSRSSSTVTTSTASASSASRSSSPWRSRGVCNSRGETTPPRRSPSSRPRPPGSRGPASRRPRSRRPAGAGSSPSRAGPGSGKTAVIDGIVRAWSALGIPRDEIAIAAPTGKAANRIAELLPADAPTPRTLHRLLGYARPQPRRADR